MRSFENKEYRPDIFAHVVFRTSQYEQMVEFYKKVLNARVAFGNEVVSFLTYDDEHHRVAVLHVPGLEANNPKAAGLEHVAYTFNRLGDLLGNYVRLKEIGITPFLAINHGPTTSMYYYDPDGNQVETQTDNFPDVETLNAFFQSETFLENPYGVEFDPDLMVQRYLAGDDEDELKRQGSAPRSTPSGYTPPPGVTVR